MAALQNECEILSLVGLLIKDIRHCRDRDRDQGQPETRASPEQVKMETEDKYHLEKFKARALDGHHRYIYHCKLIRAPSFICLST